MRTRLALAAAIGVALWSALGEASGEGGVAGEAAAGAPAAGGDAAKKEDAIVVTAARLNQARQTIQPDLGASTYSITAATIQSMPGADNTVQPWRVTSDGSVQNGLS